MAVVSANEGRPGQVLALRVKRCLWVSYLGHHRSQRLLCCLYDDEHKLLKKLDQPEQPAQVFMPLCICACVDKNHPVSFSWLLGSIFCYRRRFAPIRRLDSLDLSTQPMFWLSAG